MIQLTRNANRIRAVVTLSLLIFSSTVGISASAVAIEVTQDTPSATTQSASASPTIQATEGASAADSAVVPEAINAADASNTTTSFMETSSPLTASSAPASSNSNQPGASKSSSQQEINAAALRLINKLGDYFSKQQIFEIDYGQITQRLANGGYSLGQFLNDFKNLEALNQAIEGILKEVSELEAEWARIKSGYFDPAWIRDRWGKTLEPLIERKNNKDWRMQGNAWMLNNIWRQAETKFAELAKMATLQQDLIDFDNLIRSQMGTYTVGGVTRPGYFRAAFDSMVDKLDQMLVDLENPNANLTQLSNQLNQLDSTYKTTHNDYLELIKRIRVTYEELEKQILALEVPDGLKAGLRASLKASYDLYTQQMDVIFGITNVLDVKYWKVREKIISQRGGLPIPKNRRTNPSTQP